ncbi:hypothetical protein Y032_0010g1152 [Ancylostoma ceylanicum]|nr:hypothetical protein Y032_0010g1152 [Ancylostoma ceylanicum]
MAASKLAEMLGNCFERISAQFLSFSMQHLLQILVIAVIVTSGKTENEVSETSDLFHEKPPLSKEFHEIVEDLKASMDEKMKELEVRAHKHGIEEQVKEWFKQTDIFWEAVNKTNSELPVCCCTDSSVKNDVFVS